MKRTIAAAMVVVAAGTFGASDGRANDGWRPLTLAEAEKVIQKARAFEQTERSRRRVANSGAKDWYGSLYLEGTARDLLLSRIVTTDGRRYRVEMPRAGRVHAGSHYYKTGSALFGWLTEDVFYTSRSQPIDGTSMVVRHVYGRKRYGSVLPRGCASDYDSTSPVTLYGRGLEQFLNGRAGGYCVSGDGRTPPPRPSSSSNRERGEVGSGISGRR